MAALDRKLTQSIITNKMKKEIIFDSAAAVKLPMRTDTRGGMTAVYSEKAASELFGGFRIKEQRIYTMPRKGTFFGVHYQDASCPQAKLVSVIAGRGADYIADLRKDSKTFRQWKMIELRADEPTLVYIPAGFGHAFLSLEDDTVQWFAVDEYFVDGHARSANYKDFGLTLPTGITAISDSDKNAPFLSDEKI